MALGGWQAPLHVVHEARPGLGWPRSLAKRSLPPPVCRAPDLAYNRHQDRDAWMSQAECYSIEVVVASSWSGAILELPELE